MRETPKGMRLHIAMAGRRNAGKSALLNALANQPVSIVSSTPGATTDPVEKTMELGRLGPVVLIDTAGLDDTGDLGKMRARRSEEILLRSDAAIIVAEGGCWDDTEKELANLLAREEIPFLVARNKTDIYDSLPAAEIWREKAGLPEVVPVIDVAARKREGLDNLELGLYKITGGESSEKGMLSDILPENGLAVLVVPLDSGAPKGRLIMPQVQAMRDCLDNGKVCLVTTEKEYVSSLGKLAFQPDLVVCDSQVVKQVAQETPEAIPMTTFSILMAKLKGNLAEFAAGAAILGRLKPGDRILIQEACSHHAQKDDIGRVKIPLLLEKAAGGKLDFEFAQGKEQIAYDNKYKIVIHCGGCVITPRNMQARQKAARACHVPMTNYGMTISYCQGILRRALALFPDAIKAFES